MKKTIQTISGARASLTALCVLVFSMLFLCSPAFSDVPKNYWHSIGPWGGDRYDVFVNPADHLKVYALGGAIHQSTDGGNLWQPLMNTSVPTRGLYAYSMAINPQNPAEMFVVTFYEGIWKTTNGGELWEPANDNLPLTDLRIRSVTIDRVNPETIYIGIDNSIGGTQRAAYRSGDAGATWTPFDTGLPLTGVTSIFQNPLSNDLFAGTHGAGIYKYNSSSGSWMPMNAGLGPDRGLFITDMAFDPSNQDIIYACTKKDWVYMSINGGLSWQHIAYPEPLNAAYPPMAYYVRTDPNNPKIVWVGALPGSNYANESPFYQAEPDQDVGGLFRSADGGATWRKVMRDYGGFRLTIDPSETVGAGPDVKSKVHYLASGGAYAIMKSEDGGETFERKIAGLNGTWINVLYQHPLDSDKLFAAYESTLIFSFDAGRTMSYFKPVADSDPIYIWSFAVDPLSPSVLYYATGEPAWAWPENKGLYKIDITSLDPAQEMNHVSGELIPSTQGIGIWEVYIPVNSVLYLATQDRGVLKSTDGGQSWQEMNDGLGSMSVTCLVFDENGNPLYAGTRTNNGVSGTWYPQPGEEGAVYKWSTVTNRWARIGTTDITSAVFDLAILPNNPDTVYAGTLAGLYISGDGGAAWTKHSLGLPSDIAISGVEIDPNNTRRIVVGSWDSGVYMSVDGGNNWDEFHYGMTHLLVHDVLMDRTQSDLLYAATLGGSVFQCTTGHEPVVQSVTANAVSLQTPYAVSVKEKETVRIAVTATDADAGESLTYAAYYTNVEIPAPGENPDFPLVFDPLTKTLEWTPATGTASEQPYTIVFVVSDGVFSVQVEVDITVRPPDIVYAPEVKLSLNKSSYRRYDQMDLTGAFKNLYSPCSVDFYLAFGTPANPMKQYIKTVKNAFLPNGLDITIRLLSFRFSYFAPGEYVLTGIIVPAGGNVADSSVWLSSSTATFTFSN
ncbi:MAG: hypothetical protein AB1442_09565 [Nitrospirota bacterium]